MNILIIFGMSYLSISALSFIIQGIAKILIGSDTDQIPMKWGKILKYSFQWPYIISKLIMR